ncbi:MAG TPA: 23S rRNA (adenine(1618)-N(6))-methyltransferase RlmF [Pseudogulbenkiania sp.]|nr:23S rRNA (adenine(1618)-N(6))-methyltransferase RlmF [Pseudogulbenkiania sp.]
MTHSKTPQPKPGLHPRNLHRQRYDFAVLIAACPDLASFVACNTHGDDSIDFADPAAVKALNRALLAHHYGIAQWDIPPGYLCPPIPGRADYLHHLADLLAGSNGGVVPEKANVLDVGVGANCIYPILGRVLYGWRFVGSDIDPVALRAAKAIVEANPVLAGAIRLRRQMSSANVFRGVIKHDDRFDLTLCNPPFHASAQEAEAGTRRKLTNLTGKRPAKTVLNFGGQNAELWCDGGEAGFLHTMVMESAGFASQCCWFSSLVSKEANLPGLYRALKQAGARRVETIAMAQGQKVSRLVAWSYLDEAALAEWRATRWAR